MKRIAALAISVAGTLLVAQTERPALRSVTAIRHWSLADVTRVSVEVTGSFEYKTDRLHDPERVFYDLHNVRPRAEMRRPYAEQINDKFVQRIRVAETQPGVTRIVLDLLGSAEATASTLTGPDRLMIEVRGAPGTAPPEKPPALPPPSSSSLPAALAGKPEAPKPEAPQPDLMAQAKPPVKEVEPAAAEPATGQLAKPEGPEKMAAGPDLSKPGNSAPELPFPPSATPVAPPRFGGDVGKAARPTSGGDTSLVRALGLKVGRVVIDPGHGGHDTGTSGAKGLEEKELVLDVSKRVGKLIEERMGAEVVYTRTDDTFVPLEGRTALANDRHADLFLSIHANSSPLTRISGVEVYYLNFTDVKDALDVASRENASSQKSIFELRDIIQRITLHDKAEESREFAGRLQSSLYAFEAKSFPNTRNRGVKKAPFVVLIGATMPSVLCEIGFLSNPREESLLKKADYRQKLAEALFRGVSRYADGLSHFQVADAADAGKKAHSTPEEHR